MKPLSTLVKAMKWAVLGTVMLALPALASPPTLHVAARSGDVATIQQFVETGADLDARNDYGSTALTVAVTYGKLEAVKLLIEGGADLNLEGSGGSTPLHLATFFGRIDHVEMLLAAGADASREDAGGDTALKVAAAPFEDDLPTYEAMARALKKRGLELDLKRIEQDRAKIADILEAHTN